MRRYIKSICPLIALSVISTAVIAGQSATKLQEEATQSALLNKLGIEFHHQANHELKLSDPVTTKLQALNQQQLNQLLALKASTTHLNLDADLTAKLDELIALKKSRLASTESDTKINFLNLRLIDGLSMLNAVNSSAQTTLKVLMKMRQLADDAANGVYSTDDLRRMDMQFQAYKRLIPYVQSIDLLNGEKTVSGGDIKIQFGDDGAKDRTLTYHIRSFDLHSLNISALDIITNSNASNALASLNTAEFAVENSIAEANAGVIDDAETALANLPYVLSQDYKLFDLSLELIVKACNGLYSAGDLAILNMYFDQLKMTFNKIQAYSSLDGVKMVGGGNVHISIGDSGNAETQLVIELPVTDVLKLGLDRQTVTSQQNAYNALDAILGNIHDFAYGPAKR